MRSHFRGLDYVHVTTDAIWTKRKKNSEKLFSLEETPFRDGLMMMGLLESY